MKAVICPVCNGEGMVSAGFYSWVSSTENPVKCRSCDGRGWVEVKDEPIAYYPIPISPYPILPYPWPDPFWPETTTFTAKGE